MASTILQFDIHAIDRGVTCRNLHVVHHVGERIMVHTIPPKLNNQEINLLREQYESVVAALTEMRIQFVELTAKVAALSPAAHPPPAAAAPGEGSSEVPVMNEEDTLTAKNPFAPIARNSHPQQAQRPAPLHVWPHDAPPVDTCCEHGFHLEIHDFHSYKDETEYNKEDETTYVDDDVVLGYAPLIAHNGPPQLVEQIGPLSMDLIGHFSSIPIFEEVIHAW
ncbi:hypothetical protein OROMI_032263 [Orobanche minor]